MPYGIPWTSVIGYRCAKCKKVHTRDEHRRFCHLCGAEQPDEDEAKERGLAVFGPTANKKSTRDLAEIRDFITLHHGKPVRVWGYCVSHCELELRLRHSGAPCKYDEQWLNTVIYCSGTDWIQLPTSAWDSAMTIETIPGEYGDVHVIADESAGVRIQCRAVSLYFDVEPGY